MSNLDYAPVAACFGRILRSRASRIGDGSNEVDLVSIYKREPAPETTLAQSPYVVPLD